MEGTLLVLMAAGLVDWLINKDNEGKEFIKLKLVTGKQDHLMRDENSWNVISKFCLREKTFVTHI